MPRLSLNRVVVAAVAVGWLAMVSFLAVRLATPSDGARSLAQSSPAVGLALEPLVSSNLQTGDVVLAVDGRRIDSLARALTGGAPPAPPLAVGQTLIYTIQRGGQALSLPITLRPYPLGALLKIEWPAVVSSLAMHLLMLFLFWRRPQVPAARALCLSAACIWVATTWSFGPQVPDLFNPAAFWLYALSSTLAYLLMWPALLHALLVFPSPWPGLARRRWLLPLIYAAPFAVQLAAALVARPAHALDWLRLSGNVTGGLELVYALLLLAAAVRGYVTARDPVSRAQVRWVLAAFVYLTVFILVVALVPQLILGRPLLPWSTLALGGILLPAAFLVALLRHHLFDIDVLLNRSLVYGALTLLVIVAYVAVVDGLSRVLRQAGQPLIALLATGVVAVLIQPARAGLQRAANRLVYGDRDDPYAVLAQLGQRLATTLAAGEVLPALVETVAQTLKLPYVAVRLADAAEPAAAHGRRPAHTALESFALHYQGRAVGQLEAAPRAADEPFTPAERRLLADLARQVGVAVHNVRLNADLRQSREQLVAAREEERRRLRRDLHDGLGPQLASQALTLSAARQLLRSDPAAADALLAEAVNHAQAAVGDIRRVVYGLRPPALDDLGLVPALREQVERYRSSGVEFALTAPEGPLSLPAAVEVAAYYIAQEALNNVMGHAQARHGRLSLSVEPNGHGAAALNLEIADDGRGLPAQVKAGVGLTSMRERAEEVGGSFEVISSAAGTTVKARLPIIGMADF